MSSFLRIAISRTFAQVGAPKEELMVSWRNPGVEPKCAFPIAFRGLLFLILSSSMTLFAQAVDGIATVRENGRTVYVNDDSPRGTAAAVQPTYRPAAAPRYKYWSSVEHRWKLIPAPSAAALSAARNAVAEVASYVSAQPASSRRSTVSPGYRNLARGRQVTSAEIDKAIEEAAQTHNVDPNLVRALIKVESNFNPGAVSRKGAMGLMQLMPQTARTLKVTNPFDPKQNVDAGVRHLKDLLDSYNGDVRLSLAAYNAGQGAVARNNGIPPYTETRNYVKRITELYWNGAAPGTSIFASSAAPIRIFRNPNGVLRITNTE
jgi:soluble lytic murein transglycosylase-like protein